MYYKKQPKFQNSSINLSTYASSSHTNDKQFIRTTFLVQKLHLFLKSYEQERQENSSMDAEKM